MQFLKEKLEKANQKIKGLEAIKCTNYGIGGVPHTVTGDWNTACGNKSGIYAGERFKK